jgi:hypothetical protein
MPEPSRMAGVMPTRRLSASAMSQSQLPKTCVKVGLDGAVAFGKPSAGLNLPLAAWYLTGSASASL